MLFIYFQIERLMKNKEIHTEILADFLLKCVKSYFTEPSFSDDS